MGGHPILSRSFHLKSTLAAGLLVAVLLCAGACAKQLGYPDKTAGSAQERSDRRGENRSSSNPGVRLISLYRDHVSAVDGDRCPSHPSCSTYSMEAFKKHGFFLGWLMTVDRLIHEGSEELSVSPLVYIGGRRRIFDPVENNDFWWFKGNGREGQY
jgi:hypothetical protein